MFKNEPEVKIIADTVFGSYPRITTFELKYWRPLLPEINTHRVFSRNASSSRAITLTKRMNSILTGDLWVPKHWNAFQNGMVGKEEFVPEVKEMIDNEIATLAQLTIDRINLINNKVKKLTGEEIHHQYLNRYLEPFTSTSQLITSVEWDNFFKLRCAPDAQPEVKDIADKMKELLNSSTPEENSCHLPYIEPEEVDIPEAPLISAARCARVSYKTHTIDYDVNKDIALANRLFKAGHMSPFEHIAFAFDSTRSDPWMTRNLGGWTSQRAILEMKE